MWCGEVGARLWVGVVKGKRRTVEVWARLWMGMVEEVEVVAGWGCE